MAGELLIDTGALVSLLDRGQTHHHPCRRFFETWQGPVVSTEAVLTETTHLLSSVAGGATASVDFFLLGGAVIVPSTPASLRRVRELLVKYADLPMDFADATLVALAEELNSPLVFTTDRTDFAVYRLKDRKPFRILPEPQGKQTLGLDVLQPVPANQEERRHRGEDEPVDHQHHRRGAYLCHEPAAGESAER